LIAGDQHTAIGNPQADIVDAIRIHVGCDRALSDPWKSIKATYRTEPRHPNAKSLIRHTIKSKVDRK